MHPVERAMDKGIKLVEDDSAIIPLPPDLKTPKRFAHNKHFPAPLHIKLLLDTKKAADVESS